MPTVSATQIRNDIIVIVNGIDTAIDTLFPIASSIVFFSAVTYVLYRFIYSR